MHGVVLSEFAAPLLGIAGGELARKGGKLALNALGISNPRVRETVKFACTLSGHAVASYGTKLAIKAGTGDFVAGGVAALTSSPFSTGLASTLHAAARSTKSPEIKLLLRAVQGTNAYASNETTIRQIINPDFISRFPS